MAVHTNSHMKYLLILVAAFVGIICSECTTTKPKENTPKVAFDFPDNMTLTDAEKIEFAKKIEKGKVLYELTCAKCHNTIVNGVSTIPDFSLPQLMDYEMRIQYPSHQDRLSEANVSVDELDMIVLFLRYRKKSI